MGSSACAKIAAILTERFFARTLHLDSLISGKYQMLQEIFATAVGFWDNNGAADGALFEGLVRGEFVQKYNLEVRPDTWVTSPAPTCFHFAPEISLAGRPFRALEIQIGVYAYPAMSIISAREIWLVGRPSRALTSRREIQPRIPSLHLIGSLYLDCLSDCFSLRAQNWTCWSAFRPYGKPDCGSCLSNNFHYFCSRDVACWSAVPRSYNPERNSTPDSDFVLDRLSIFNSPLRFLFDPHLKFGLLFGCSAFSKSRPGIMLK
jgi:hypothetical protein